MSMTRKSFLKTVAGAAMVGGFLHRGPASLLQAQEKSRVPARATRIRDVEILPFSLPQKAVMHIALGSISTIDNILVRLRTEDGVIGYGEASPYWAVTSETQQSDVAMGRSLAELIKGQDPFTLARIVANMDAFAPESPSIKAAIEMAIWDICGRIAGQPVYRLLGEYRNSFETDLTIYMDTPSAMAEAAKEVVAQGFKTIKIKVGESPEIDAERLRAVREVVGRDIKLRIDANQGWSPADAVRALRMLEKYQIQFCEQPVPSWDWDGMKYVREHAPMPVMADETVHSPHDAIQAVRHECCDIINIKLMKSGGILNAVRIAEIAAAANMKCMLGCMMESRIGLTAAAHVVASQKNVEYADLDSFKDTNIDPVIGGMEVKDGIVRLPQTPGLGLDLDPTFLNKLRPA